MLNSEIFPPVADITYESFLESAMHGTASSRLTPATSLAIRRPLLGSQCCGTALAVAFKYRLTSESLRQQKISLNIHKIKQSFLTVLLT